MYIDKEDVGESSSSQHDMITRRRGNIEADQAEGGSIFENLYDVNYNEEEDEDYIGGDDGSDSNRSVSSESGESDEDNEDDCGNRGRIVRGHFHTYSEMGPSNPSKVDREPGQLQTWNGYSNSLRKNTCFNTKDEVKRAVTIWSVEQKRKFYVKESTTTTWVAWCLSLKYETPIGCVDCLWKIRASKKAHGMWQMVKWQPQHNCFSRAIDNDNRNVTSTYICRLVMAKVENNFEYSVSSVQTDVKQILGVEVRYKKAWHGRRKAIEAIYGDWCGNISILPSYMDALQRSNPSTVVEYEFLNGWSETERQLRYVFWAFGPAIQTFHMSPPVISIDGTHLRGGYKGKLLMAMVKTANSRILPIAYAMVDEESLDSWTFFLKYLVAHVLGNRTVCIISDRHQGIIGAMENLHICEGNEDTGYHVYCLRHLHTNLVAKFKDDAVTRLFWQLGKKLSPSKWNRARERLIKANHAAWRYLLAVELKKWTLAHGEQVRWGHLITNISESYNNALKGTRFLPIRALVDATLTKTVKIYQEEVVKANQCDTALPPLLWSIYVNRDKVAAWHNVVFFDAVREIFKVTTYIRPSMKGGNEHIVYYKDRRCTCQKWQEHRLPCSHAVAVCRKLGHNAHSLVDNCLTTRGWKLQFENARFSPVPAVTEWRNVGYKLFPDYTRLVLHVGRKRKNRFRGQMDYTRRRGTVHDCTTCGSDAHTASACPNTHPRTDRRRLADAIYDSN